MRHRFEDLESPVLILHGECKILAAFAPVAALDSYLPGSDIVERRRPAKSGAVRSYWLKTFAYLTRDILRASEYYLSSMVKSPLRVIVSLVVSAGLAIPSIAAQATFRVITDMSKYTQPVGLTEGSPGVFYLFSGSAPSAVMSVTTQGSKAILATFPSGNIESQLVSGDDGRFYSVFQPNNTAVTLFSVSAVPGGLQYYASQIISPNLTQNLPDGTFLGTGVALAGTPWYLIKTDSSYNVTPLYQFPSGQRLPTAAVYASDGNYYGVSQTNPAGTGYVYRVTPSGSLTILYSFPANSFAGYYLVPLLQASDGNLYGATPTGGANGTGTIYEMTLSGDYTLLYTFPAGKKYNPNALIEGSDGNLYGVTLGGSADSQLFRLTKSGQYTVLYAMDTLQSGQCNCWLTLGSDGIIYGTAQGGGLTFGGTVFALNAGLPKPAPRPRQFSPQAGPVGTNVMIWGQNMLSASAQFNGVPATAVSNSGPNYVLATVPIGATTGPITVTTPGGTYTTKTTFTVQ